MCKINRNSGRFLYATLSAQNTKWCQRTPHSMNSTTAHKFGPWWWLRSERNVLQCHVIQELPPMAICYRQHSRNRGSGVGSETPFGCCCSHIKFSPFSCYFLLSVGPSILLSATWSSLLYQSKFIAWILWNISCKDNVCTDSPSL
jgi:hypothetical protein